jgi:hypothetical protein
LIITHAKRAMHAHMFGKLADHQVESTMNRPYTLRDVPPKTYTDGQPYTFTIAVSDQGYHARFHDCYIVYEITEAGYTYLTKWEMIRCKKQAWNGNGILPKYIDVVVLARNPIPFEPGCVLGVLLGLLPKGWRAKIIRHLRKIRTKKGRMGSGGGQGTIYGSNDQDATEDSSSSASSQSMVPPRHLAAGSSSLSTTSASSSSSSSSSMVAGGRRFRRHHEVESWFVTKASDNLDQAYDINEA